LQRKPEKVSESKDVDVVIINANARLSVYVESPSEFARECEKLQLCASWNSWALAVNGVSCAQSPLPAPLEKVCVALTLQFPRKTTEVGEQKLFDSKLGEDLLKMKAITDGCQGDASWRRWPRQICSSCYFLSAAPRSLALKVADSEWEMRKDESACACVGECLCVQLAK